MRVEVAAASLEAVDALDVDTLLLFVPSDERPLQGLAGLLDWRMTGGLSRLLVRGWITGTPGEVVLAPTTGGLSGRRLFAVGLGPAAALDADTLKEAARAAGRALVAARVEAVASTLPAVPGLTPPAIAKAVRAGLEAQWDGRLKLLGDTKVLREVFSEAGDEPGAAREEPGGKKGRKGRR